MMNFLRSNWSRISTGLLLATLFGVGGMTAYERLAGDCCYPGSPCCHPGSPCCHGHQAPPPR